MPWANGPSRTSFTSPEHRARRARVLKRDGYVCQICTVGICIGCATIADHILALGLGGDDTDENMQAACGPCSKHKTQQESAEARRRRRAQVRRPPEGHPGLA